MGLRTAKILQALFVVMLAWYFFSVLGGWHWILVVALVVFSGANAATIWILRHNPEIVARLCSKPVFEKYVSLICKATGQPRPVDLRPGSSANQLLLRSNQDFEIALHRAKPIVRGHDRVLECVLSRIHENLTLRATRRTSKSLGPIASFLLIGRAGIGKRYLSRVVSKLLYRSGRVEVFECDRITVQSLIGGKGHPGDLLGVARAEPFQMLVFENVDRASADVSTVLQRLLTSGELTQPGTQSSVSFRNTTLVFTTEAVDSVENIDREVIGPAAWQQHVIDCLRDEHQIDGGLLSTINDILFCEAPSDEVKAEVISLLLQKECRAHGLELSHVDPIIMGTQVLQIRDGTGFAHAPSRIKKLLSKPLVAAATNEHDSLSLRVATEANEPTLMTVDR